MKTLFALALTALFLAVAGQQGSALAASAPSAVAAGQSYKMVQTAPAIEVRHRRWNRWRHRRWNRHRHRRCRPVYRCWRGYYGRRCGWVRRCRR